MARLWLPLGSLILVVACVGLTRAEEVLPTGSKNVTAAPPPAGGLPVGEDERVLVVKTAPREPEAGALENQEESVSSSEEDGKKAEDRSSNMFQQEEEDRGDSDVSEERYS